jgi:hypothetical protein
MPLQSTSGQFLFDQSNLLDNITVNKNRKRMLTFSFYNIKEEREKYLDLGEKTDDDLETKNYVIHRRGEPEWPPMYSCRFYKVKDGEEIFIGERVCKYGCSIIDEVDYIIVYDSPYAHLYYDWEKIKFQDTNIKMQLVSSFCYTRTMDIPNQRTTHIDGYSEVIDYYHPQYNREIIPGEVDYRRTLYWNPCIKLNEEGKADVMFYNNSTCKYPIISVETLND